MEGVRQAVCGQLKGLTIIKQKLVAWRFARDAKVASDVAPRKIDQLIGRQNNIGDTTGLEGLLNQEAVRKLLE